MSKNATDKREPFAKHPIKIIKIHLNNFLIDESSPVCCGKDKKRQFAAGLQF